MEAGLSSELSLSVEFDRMRTADDVASFRHPRQPIKKEMVAGWPAGSIFRKTQSSFGDDIITSLRYVNRPAPPGGWQIVWKISPNVCLRLFGGRRGDKRGATVHVGYRYGTVQSVSR